MGDEVFIRTNRNEIFNGNIFYLRKDSIYFRYATIAANSIVELKLKKRRRLHFDLAEFGWVTLGVGLTTAGLVAADWYKFPKAFQTATSIGYTPYLLRLLGLLSFKKFHYKIGKRYQLLVWDIR